MRFTSQLFSSADESLKDETHLLLLTWFTSDAACFLFHHIPSVVGLVHIFMVRSRVAKSCLKAGLYFHRLVHFPCVLIYTYIHIHTHTHRSVCVCICVYIICSIFDFQTLTSLLELFLSDTYELPHIFRNPFSGIYLKITSTTK